MNFFIHLPKQGKRQPHIFFFKEIPLCTATSSPQINVTGAPDER